MPDDHRVARAERGGGRRHRERREQSHRFGLDLAVSINRGVRATTPRFGTNLSELSRDYGKSEA